MRTFKTFAGAMLCAAVLSSPGFAQDEEPVDAPTGKAAFIFSNFPKRYLLQPHDLRRWSAGVFFQNIQREVMIGSSMENVKIRRVTGQIGLDLLSWLTIYGAAGLSEFSAELATGSDRGDDEETWTAGVRLRLIEYYLLGGDDLEDRLIIDVDARYIDVTGRTRSRDAEWEQTETILRIGVVNEIDQDRGYAPEEVTIWFGPVLSTVEGTLTGGFSEEITELDDVGIAGGIDIRFSRHASLVWDAQLYDEKLTYNVGVNFDF